MASLRHAKANNPQMHDYDPSQSTSHLLYLDSNNLYGWAMSQTLPTGSFQWIEPSSDWIERILEHPKDSDVGYILEVDLEYPESLHSAHNEYPLAPERLTVTPDMLSPYQTNLIDELQATGVTAEKLVPT